MRQLESKEMRQTEPRAVEANEEPSGGAQVQALRSIRRAVWALVCVVVVTSVTQLLLIGGLLSSLEDLALRLFPGASQTAGLSGD